MSLYEAVLYREDILRSVWINLLFDRISCDYPLNYAIGIKLHLSLKSLENKRPAIQIKWKKKKKKIHDDVKRLVSFKAVFFYNAMKHFEHFENTNRMWAKWKQWR